MEYVRQAEAVEQIRARKRKEEDEMEDEVEDTGEPAPSTSKVRNEMEPIGEDLEDGIMDFPLYGHLHQKLDKEKEKRGIENEEEDSINTMVGQRLAKVREEMRKNFKIDTPFGVDLAKANLTGEESRALATLLSMYKDVFARDANDLGKTALVKHQIQTGTEAPIKSRPYRVPLALREAMEELIEAMLKQGVIKRSNSPWAAPVVLVKKQDQSIRFCVDYRKVNRITRQDAYPLPRIDEMLDCLNGAAFFTTLDLQ
jgi:hypothetical protein